MTNVYLVTKQRDQYNPHEREVFQTKDEAIQCAHKLSGERTPADTLDGEHWKVWAGNQHAPTRWMYQYEETDPDRRITIYIRKFNLD